jgi:C4-dicarboxylate-specific signal transduction histidine kinase
MKKNLKPQLGEVGYVNKNCWLTNILQYPPARRCRYCQLRFLWCPFIQFAIISLLIMGIGFLISWLGLKEISSSVLFIILFCVFAYGYFFNRATVKIIEANFEVYQAKQKLEEKVKERTKELEELAKHLEEKVQEKTKELRMQKESLEKEVARRTKELQELNEKLEEEVKRRTRELLEKVEELQRMNKLAVGRELKMVEMKAKIQKLEEELKRCQENLKPQ